VRFLFYNDRKKKKDLILKKSKKYQHFQENLKVEEASNQHVYVVQIELIDDVLLLLFVVNGGKQIQKLC